MAGVSEAALNAFHNYSRPGDETRMRIGLERHDYSATACVAGIQYSAPPGFGQSACVAQRRMATARWG